MIRRIGFFFFGSSSSTSAASGAAVAMGHLYKNKLSPVEPGIFN
jgi:hypothetical protein